MDRNMDTDRGREMGVGKQGRAVAVKRVYEPAEPEDGLRVLVDRLWPRGISKQDARIDLWLKELAPSPALRAWFGHDPDKFPEFRRRYEAELASGEAHAALERLRELLRRGPATLVFGARDAEHSNAAVLKELLEKGRPRARRRAAS